MKNLKLTNLEKMPQKEMEQIKGGMGPWIGWHKKMKGRCLCVTWCSGDESRADEGTQLESGNYATHHW